MIKNLFKDYIYPVTTLTGGIVGVGFLSLPYIASKVGIFTMLFYFIILVPIVLFLHLIFGQICLKTPDFKRWPGFVGFYLGNTAKKIILVLDILGLLGILLVYLLIGSQFLWAIASPFLGGEVFYYTLIYFMLGSIFIYFGIKAISRFNFFAITFLVVVICLIFIKGFPQIHLDNIFFASVVGDWKTMFLPYGAIIFALWGTGFIPEVEEMVSDNKRSLKKIITTSILLVALFYLLFIFLILGISGSKTTDSALTGLAHFGLMYPVALSMGLVSTFIAFIAMGLLLKKIFMYDMGLKEFPAWLLTCFVPLVLFLLGLNSFIPLISFVGGVFLGIDGILILLIYQKIGGKKMITYPLMSVFILGIIYSIVYFAN